MTYVIGIVLSVGVAVFAGCVELDRDRAFYPVVMMVIASYYVLFAAMTGSVHTVLLESVGMTLFVIPTVIGLKSSAWIVVAALADHGVFDAVHEHILENSGVPVWWPAFLSRLRSRRCSQPCLARKNAGQLHMTPGISLMPVPRIESNP